MEPALMMKTSLGDIVLELAPANAPITVTNFLGYVADGFYSSKIFHRVVNGIEGANVGVHIRLAHFAEPFVLKQPLQLFTQGNELGVLLVKVVSQCLARLAQGVFELIGQDQLFFPDLGEFEDDVFQRDVEQVAGVRC